MQLLNLNKNIKLIFTWEGLLFIAANLLSTLGVYLFLLLFVFPPSIYIPDLPPGTYIIIIIICIAYLRFAIVPTTINFIRYNTKNNTLKNLINNILSSIKAKLIMLLCAFL